MEVIWRQDCYQLPTGRTSLGFKDGIGQLEVEGSEESLAPIPRSHRSRPVRSFSVIRTKRDNDHRCQPGVLGRNGTYVVFRKLHTRVAAYGNTFMRSRKPERNRTGSARK